MRETQKYSKFIKISLIIAMMSVILSQSNSVGFPNNTIGPSTGFANSILNPNRLTMNHSVSFTATSGSGYSGSVGMYSNYINYKFSEKMELNAGLHLIKPSFSNGLSTDQQFNFNFDIHLKYRFSDNFSFYFTYAKLSPKYWNYRY